MHTHTHTGQGMGISVAGRIEQGHVQCGEGVLVAPAWETAVIKCEEAHAHAHTHTHTHTHTSLG